MEPTCDTSHKSSPTNISNCKSDDNKTQQNIAATEGSNLKKYHHLKLQPNNDFLHKKYIHFVFLWFKICKLVFYQSQNDPYYMVHGDILYGLYNIDYIF